MPRVEIALHTSDGQTIVLSEKDRLVKTVVIECCSKRCASRHGQDKPLEVSLVEGEPMPEVGDQWLSLILPERSPQYTPMPPNFCGPQCARDFLIYDYLAPQPRASVSTETEQPDPSNLPAGLSVVYSGPSVSQADGDPGDEPGARDL